MSISNEELRIRLKTEKRIYQDSPQITVTYIDLVRFIELFEDILESNKQIGFGK